MPKYEVIRPWHGVEVGQLFEADSINPALASHVREVKPKADADATLTPATPDAATPAKRGPKPKADADAIQAA